MGGKIGALVRLEGSKDDAAQQLGKEVAMHVAAAAPRYLTSDQVSQDELKQEQDIARKKLLEEKKPEHLVEKIMQGQMQKFYKEICLVDQAFIKDPSVSVAKYADQTVKGVTVAAFARFQLGEGIEKKQENFADEVAAQLK
jgi:elongation factor Ts